MGVSSLNWTDSPRGRDTLSTRVEAKGTVGLFVGRNVRARPILDRRSIHVTPISERSDCPEAPRSKRSIALVVALGLVMSMLILSLPSMTERASAYSSHLPISIAGNGGFTVANGVTGGSGTAGSPWVISGWEIVTNSAIGISITGTTEHFVVRDVYIHGNNLHDGISLVSVSNGDFVNTSCTRNYEGVSLESSSEITLFNCSLNLNYDNGLYCWDANDVTITDSSLSQNYYGIYVDSPISNVEVRNCTINENGDGGVLFYSDVTNCTISDCTIDLNEYYDGIYVYGIVQSMTISNCSISSNEGSGVLMEDYSNDVVIANNTIDSNGEYGIRVYGGDRVSILNNSVSMSYYDGIQLGYTYISGGCDVSGNDVTGSGENGITIDSQDSTIVSHNTIEDSQYSGIDFDGRNCEIENNTIRGSVEFGLYVSSWSYSNEFSNNTFERNGMFVYFEGSDGNSIVDNTVNGKPLIFLEGVSSYSVPDAGQVIAHDCTGLIIEHMDLSNSSVGVELWDCSRCTIANVTSDDNMYGTFIKNHSSSNSIMDCHLCGNAIGASFETDCTNNVIEGTNLSDNRMYGVDLNYLCNDVSIIDCDIWDSGDTGVLINSCSRTRVIGSSIEGSVYCGVRMSGFGQNSVEGCHFSGWIGVVAQSVSDCVIANNTFGCISGGVILGPSSSDNLVLSNTVRGSSLGIAVNGDSSLAICTGNRVLNNTVELNTYRGILLSYATGNTIAGNKVVQNAVGIYVDSTYAGHNWIYLNNFTGNTLNADCYYSGTVNYWNTSTQVTYMYMGNWYTGYLGNYWGNYSGTDGDGNGVGDTPYLFRNGRDNYPLMSDGSTIIPEFGSLLVPVVSLMLLVLTLGAVTRGSRSPRR
jgi:parallel beta-helix repeat protein